MSRSRRGTRLSISLLASAMLFPLLVCPLSPDRAWGQETPRYGGTFIVGTGGDPVTLNLASGFSTIDTLAAASVFNMLVKSDADLNPQPDL